MQFDIVVVGAGPAGLSFARSLADTGLSIALVEVQPEAALAEPGFDGREIALTHGSVRLLRDLDAWDRVPAADVSPLREARVLNGSSSYFLRFDPPTADGEPLGWLVPNHAIRKSLYESVAELPNFGTEIRLLAGKRVAGVEVGPDGALVRLEGRGESGSVQVEAKLVVAADTRFSETRRRQGIPATAQDFGKAMLVCRMAHDLPHDAVATEWFDYGQTFATLPLNGDGEHPHVSSAVLTLPAEQIDRLMALDEAAFNREMTERLSHRFGAMTLIGTRHAYPLVAVYADRFVKERFAVIGDAAVGMHPVTAHGFNFGLTSQQILAEEIRTALARGRDFAGLDVLRRYESRHRRATKPLYLATLAVVQLYTDDRPLARAIRSAGLFAGNHLPLFRSSVLKSIMERGAPPLPKLPSLSSLPRLPKLPLPFGR